MGLDSELNGVQPSSPEGASTSGGTNSGAEPRNQDPGTMGDRSDLNLQKEFDRKLQAMSANFSKQLSEFASKTQDILRESMKQRSPEPKSHGASGTVSETAVANEPEGGRQYTTTQLKAMLQNPSIKPEQTALVNQILAARATSSAPPQQEGTGQDLQALVRGVIQEEDKKRLTEQYELESKQEAVDRFPALTEEDSPFRQTVDQELARRRAAVGVVPGDILDVANRVAAQLGVQAKTTTRRVGGGFVAPHNTGGAPRTEEEKGAFELSDERYATVSKALERAMPVRDGKRVGFDKKNIMEGSKALDQNSHLFGIPNPKR